jgi:hypothetical protein
VGALSERYRPENEGDAQRNRIRAGERIGEIESSIERQDPVSIQDPRFDIVSHHRGTEGVPFPESGEVVLEAPSNTADTATPQRIPDYWISSPAKVSRPPKCVQSGTSVVQRREKGDKNVLIFDRLYLSQELSPLDTSDIYGTETMVQVYDGDHSAEVYLRMESDGVPCVPYRIRYTDTHAFYHRGEDALANFDRDLSGRGQTHPWVKKKMEKLRTTAF